MLSNNADTMFANEVESKLLTMDESLAIAIRFRPAQSLDWHQLQRNCYPDHDATLLRRHFERSLEQQARSRGHWLVATVADEVVGAGQLSPYGSRLEIANMAVSPRWRKRGIGSALVTRLNEQAAILGYHTVDISVAANNSGALRLYRRLGFEHCHYLRQGSMPAIVVLRLGTETALVV